LKAPDNPEGVDGSAFDELQTAIKADRYAFFAEFFKNFYNTRPVPRKEGQRTGLAV